MASLILCLVILLVHGSHSTSLTKVKPGIVDGAGYALRNLAFPTLLKEDLVMEAVPASQRDGASLTPVQLTPWRNSPSQKWGVEFYGSPTAALTSGANRENGVTTYVSSTGRLLSRQYTFLSEDGNESFRIRNSETRLCLGAKEKGADILVDFMPCNGNNEVKWSLERTG